MVHAPGPSSPPSAGVLRGILDTLPVGLVLFDPEGVPRLVNRAAREVLGDLASAPLARWVDNRRIARPDGTPLALADLPPWATLADRAPRREIELTIRGPRGDPAPVLLATEAVLDQDGAVLQVACAVTSIGEVCRREQAVRRELKLQAIGTLAHGLAGPLNDALTAIAGYCDLAASRLDRADPVRQVVAEIQQAGGRAAMVTGRLLAHAEREVPVPVVLDLDRWLGRHLTVVRGLAGDHIEVEAQANAAGAHVRVDPRLLEQVIADLVGNARDAMSEGGRLTLTTMRTEIDPDLAPLLGADRAGVFGIIAVRDTGGGMDERTLPRIFEPFFTTKPGALGMGLATVERIVRSQGGFVRVETRRGEGSTFHVHLPVVTEPVEPEPKQAPAFDRRARVLLVEDDAVVRDLVHEVLEMKRLVVVEAHTATEALTLLDEDTGTFDLLITDLVLPGLGGDQLARRIHTDRPDLKVLLMSGCSDGERIAGALHESGAGFLPKPFTPEALLQKVQEVLAPEQPAAV